MREQTTIRIPAELAARLEAIAEKENESINALVIEAVKRIVKRYRFDERGALIEA